MNRYFAVLSCCLALASCLPNLESFEERDSKSNEDDKKNPQNYECVCPKQPEPLPAPANPLVQSCQSLYPNNRIVHVRDNGCNSCNYACYDDSGRSFLMPKSDGQSCGGNSICYVGKCYESDSNTQSACRRYFNTNRDTVIAIRNRDEPCRVYCGRNGANRLEPSYMNYDTLCNTVNNSMGYCNTNAVCSPVNFNYRN